MTQELVSGTALALCSDSAPSILLKSMHYGIQSQSVEPIDRQTEESWSTLGTLSSGEVSERMQMMEAA